ncbi:UxaA family hydrolase [Sediminibacillus massiliensis]|uniref:UxaA family hydrolase n=1 Tax=Sediminibacillus massiliensis TaxID=1926277 RepID=UPI0009888D33|nr:altronate dehydratase family protein [Sediminibacillus massiliensis]
MLKTRNVMQINQKDNVLVVLKDFQKGEVLSHEEVEFTLEADIPSGHKVALRTIEDGEDVVKYGHPIGKARRKINVGEWVHTHNVRTKLEGTMTYDYKPKKEALPVEDRQRTFQGYVRKNGEVGIRNEIWVINTVGCINKVAEQIVKLAEKTYAGAEIDGIHHYPHPFGCSQLGDDLANTQKVLRNLANHPNAGGVLVLGLGCENNHIKSFKQVLGDYDDDRIKFLASQEVSDELEAGVDLIGDLIDYATTFTRQPVPVSKLKVGLKCGGSDGLSGITANPLVGSFSDKVIASGGTTILTEVPEMFGAEQLLMERAKDVQVFTKIEQLINDFKNYFIKHDQVVYENPSPGNKDGGISTLEEKSLGCVQKGGFAEVVDVLPYGGVVTEQGLNLLQGPGNDLVSVTSLAASGAHIVLFTTGRGTPFGGPVPTVKISTNTALYEKKKNWIDFNAGELVTGKDKQVLTDELFDYVLKLASGEIETKNEEFGFKEIAIFKDGVIL